MAHSTLATTNSRMEAAQRRIRENGGTASDVSQTSSARRRPPALWNTKGTPGAQSAVLVVRDVIRVRPPLVRNTLHLVQALQRRGPGPGGGGTGATGAAGEGNVVRLVKRRSAG